MSLVSGVLCYIFNKSLQRGCFPTAWKDAIIAPVIKSWSRLLAGNFRPVAQSFVVRQNFEYCVFNVINPWAKTFITEDEYGFMAGRSLEMNLVVWLAFILSELYSRGQFEVIYLTSLRRLI